MTMKDKLKLWCLAYGVEMSCLDDARVAAALADNDAVDTLRAVQRVSYNHDAEAFSPLGKLQFIGLFRE